MIFVLTFDLCDRIDKVLCICAYGLYKAGRGNKTMVFFTGKERKNLYGTPHGVKPKRQHEGKHGRRTKIFLLIALFTVFLSFFTTTTPRPAQAAPCFYCSCSYVQHFWSRAYIIVQHNITRWYISWQFDLHRDWWVRVLWRRFFLPALMEMTEQLSAIAMQQMEITGAFIDAKHQLETQAYLQALEARTLKNYQPDVEICAIGSHATSLASTERRGELNTFLLAQRLQERQILGSNSSGTLGPRSDVMGRLAQFKEVYCDPQDNNGTLSAICGAGTPDRVNRDIDFGRTLAQPLSLDVAFDDTAISEPEEDVLALASNLYAHKVLPYVSEDALADEGNKDEYLDLRSVVAKRSVAENSYNALVGLKSRGGNASPYNSMEAVLREMGITDPNEIREIIGEYPSYYAQMEFLTKKLYQRPEFYVNLYGKPINAKRKSTAIRAIGLMQNMDLFESQLRAEAALSVLLEMKILREHKDVQNRLQRLRAVGRMQ